MNLLPLPLWTGLLTFAAVWSLFTFLSYGRRALSAIRTNRANRVGVVQPTAIDRPALRPRTVSTPRAPECRPPGQRRGPWANGRFGVHGHRGASGLVVESTLEGFAAAYELGVTSVELDVRLTADGHPVVWHDPVLLATKCRPTGPDLIGARVGDLTLDQLRTVDVGSQTRPGFPGQRAAPGARISTLREVLTHGEGLAPDLWWTLEVKIDPREPGAATTRRTLLRGILEDMHDLGIERRCFVHSFDWSVLELARAEAPDVARSALVEPRVTWMPDSPWTGSVRVQDHGPDVCAGVAEVGAHVVSPEDSLVDAALVERAHALGLAVLPWTVNDPERIRSMIELGVDGLVSDYPDRALACLAGA